MCGYVRYEQQTIIENISWLSRIELIASALMSVPDYTAYPAFGGDIHRRIPLIVNSSNLPTLVNAIWWFDANVDNCDETVLGKRTTFNARNLTSPFWQESLKYHRGVILANAIGESKLIGKTKHQFLMQSDTPFLLGALFRKLSNGDYSCAIITRDVHKKMEPYHDKAFPLFLPPQNEFIGQWLSSTSDIPVSVQQLLKVPKLFPTLRVTRVQSFKSTKPIGSLSAQLVSDCPELLGN